MKIVIEIEE